jgi:hypothetical protein
MPVTPTQLGLQGAYISNCTLPSAGTVIAAIPTPLVFLAFRRYFVDGLTLGAVKLDRCGQDSSSLLIRATTRFEWRNDRR